MGTVREIRTDLEGKVTRNCWDIYESCEKEKTNHLIHIETPDGCKAYSVYTRALMGTL